MQSKKIYRNLDAASCFEFNGDIYQVNMPLLGRVRIFPDSKPIMVQSCGQYDHHLYPAEMLRPAEWVPTTIEHQPLPKICATCGHWGVDDLPDDGNAFSGYCECLLSRNCDQLLYFDHGCDRWQECPQLAVEEKP